MRLLTLALLLTACSGCVVALEKDARVGVQLTNGLEFYHSAPDDGAKASIDLLPTTSKLLDKLTDPTPADLPTIDHATGEEVEPDAIPFLQ